MTAQHGQSAHVCESLLFQPSPASPSVLNLRLSCEGHTRGSEKLLLHPLSGEPLSVAGISGVCFYYSGISRC